MKSKTDVKNMQFVLHEVQLWKFVQKIAIDIIRKREMVEQMNRTINLYL